MKKIYLLLLGLVTLVSTAQTQLPVDSLGFLNLRALPDGWLTKQQRVQMIQAQLMEALLDGQPTRIPPIVDYLEHRALSRQSAVSPRVALSLLLAAGAYDQLLQQVVAENPGRAQWVPAKQELLAGNLLASIAESYTAGHIEELSALAQRLPPEQAAVIRVLLDVLPRGGVSPAMDAEMNSFKQQFPHSEYGYLLRDLHNAEQNKIRLHALYEEEEKQNQQAREAEWRASELARREYTRNWRVAYDAWELKSGRPSRFRYGLDFHSGTGFFTNGLNATFRPRFNLGTGFEFGWDRFMLYLRNYIGWAEARTDFSYDGHVWPAGQTLNYYVPEVSAGFRLVDRQHFMLTPFAGLSWFDFAPPSSDSKNNPSLKMDVSMRYPFTAGLNLDIPAIKTRNGSEQGYWMLKIRSGVRTAEAPLRPALHGTLFYLDIGIGGFGRMLRSTEASPRR